MQAGARCRAEGGLVEHLFPAMPAGRREMVAVLRSMWSQWNKNFRLGSITWAR